MKKMTLCALLVMVMIAACFLHIACRRDPEFAGSSPPSHPRFIPSATFCGRKNGYVFKTDEGVTGYYADDAGG